MKLNIDLPDKLRFLYEPYRYKVAHSGRGAGKSWGFADALIVRAIQQRTRILCAREIQKSIKQSVHTLIADRIHAHGLASQFEILETTIRHRRTRSEFLYTGLQGHTADTIKSFEGCDIAWVEEAQTVPKRSWEILIPTIRKEGATTSEIWVSMNPELDTDYTWTNFVLNPPPGAAVVKLTYRDNKFFPNVLEYERLRAKAQLSEEDYNYIWEGIPRSSVTGAIYSKELAQMQNEDRVGRVLYDPRLPVHYAADIGLDGTVIGFFQKTPTELRMIDYLENDNLRSFDEYLVEMQGKGYHRGVFILPHDGAARNIRSKYTPEQLAKQFGFTTRVLDNTSLETGITVTKGLFRNLIIDSHKCAVFLEHLRRYRKHYNKQLNRFTHPEHDEHSHAADMLRYACVGVEYMRNESQLEMPRAEWQKTVPGMGY